MKEITKNKGKRREENKPADTYKQVLLTAMNTSTEMFKTFLPPVKELRAPVGIPLTKPRVENPFGNLAGSSGVSLSACRGVWAHWLLLGAD